jgi:hypothetical protein
MLSMTRGMHDEACTHAATRKASGCSVHSFHSQQSMQQHSTAASWHVWVCIPSVTGGVWLLLVHADNPTRHTRRLGAAANKKSVLIQAARLSSSAV